MMLDTSACVFGIYDGEAELSYVCDFIGWGHSYLHQVYVGNLSIYTAALLASFYVRKRNETPGPERYCVIAHRSLYMLGK